MLLLRPLWRLCVAVCVAGIAYKYAHEDANRHADGDENTHALPELFNDDFRHSDTVVHADGNAQ